MFYFQKSQYHSIPTHDASCSATPKRNPVAVGFFSVRTCHEGAGEGLKNFPCMVEQCCRGSWWWLITHDLDFYGDRRIKSILIASSAETVIEEREYLCVATRLTLHWRWFACLRKQPWAPGRLIADDKTNAIHTRPLLQALFHHGRTSGIERSCVWMDAADTLMSEDRASAASPYAI